MRFWKRRASLQVGTSRYQLDDLKFSFEVTSEDDAGIPICKLEIYNLAPSTRAAISKGTPIIVNAGYQDDIGSVLSAVLHHLVMISVNLMLSRR